MAEVEHSHWWYDATRRLLQQLLGADASKGGRFLDVGAGTGATGAWLADHGELVSCDFMPLALDLNREQHAATGFVSADVQRLPFADGSFDIVLCVTVLCHQSIPRPQVAVDELARVARPGGLVCLWEPGVRRLWRAHDRETHSARRFARSDLSTMAEAAGLHVERASGAYSFLVPPAAIKSVLERGESTSDLDRNRDGLWARSAPRRRPNDRYCSAVDLPAGLTVFALGRK